MGDASVGASVGGASVGAPVGAAHVPPPHMQHALAGKTPFASVSDP